MDDDNKIDKLEVEDTPYWKSKLMYTCGTCKYDDYPPESKEGAWCVDTGPDGGWKTEKGHWEPKENKGE